MTNSKIWRKKYTCSIFLGAKYFAQELHNGWANRHGCYLIFFFLIYTAVNIQIFMNWRVYLQTKCVKIKELDGSARLWAMFRELKYPLRSKSDIWFVLFWLIVVSSASDTFSSLILTLSSLVLHSSLLRPFLVAKFKLLLYPYLQRKQQRRRPRLPTSSSVQPVLQVTAWRHAHCGRRCHWRCGRSVGEDESCEPLVLPAQTQKLLRIALYYMLYICRSYALGRPARATGWWYGSAAIDGRKGWWNIL